MYNYRVPQIHVVRVLLCRERANSGLCSLPAQAPPTEASGARRVWVWSPVPLWASATPYALVTQLMEASKSGTVWFK